VVPRRPEPWSTAAGPLSVDVIARLTTPWGSGSDDRPVESTIRHVPMLAILGRPHCAGTRRILFLSKMPTKRAAFAFVVLRFRRLQSNGSIESAEALKVRDESSVSPWC
jgi:hypothetical protein